MSVRRLAWFLCLKLNEKTERKNNPRKRNTTEIRKKETKDQTSMMERFGGNMPLPENNHLSSISTFVLEHTENI